MTSAMATAILEKAAWTLHDLREGERARERASEHWWRQHGRPAASLTQTRADAARASALAMLGEVWESNLPTCQNIASAELLNRVNQIADEYGLPLFEHPRQRPAAMPRPKSKVRIRAYYK